MKTTAKQAKKKLRPTVKPGAVPDYYAAALVAIRAYHRRYLAKLELLHELCLMNPKLWPRLDSFLSPLRENPVGFKDVAIDQFQAKGIFELWMKRFGCRQCGSKKQEHAYRDWNVLKITSQFKFCEIRGGLRLALTAILRVFRHGAQLLLSLRAMIESN